MTLPTSTWLPSGRDNISVHPCTRDAMPGRMAADIANRLALAIRQRGQAVLCVSGGKSPIALFQALRTQAVDWARVTVTLCDERCVPTLHADSNARLVQTHLLQGAAARANWVPMINQLQGPLPPAETLCLDAAAALQQAGPADVLVLGMGPDGHTASLFPGAPQLLAALDMHNDSVCSVIERDEQPSAPYARISQTLAQLLRARCIVLPIEGADKLLMLERAWASSDARYPVSYVLNQGHTPVDLWLGR